MELLQLEYFIKVAKGSNMTSAASELNVAQSSVSRSIARLESSLGVPLFERKGKSLQLNDYGKAFYKRAENILREIVDGEREITEMRDEHIGRVSISCCAARQINRLMIECIESNPNVIFKHKRTNDISEIKSELDKGNIDLALTYIPIAHSEYIWTPLIVEQYYLLISSGHKFADRKSISLSELKDEKFLVNSSDNPEFISACCEKAGFTPNIKFIVHEDSIVGHMVERGIGASFASTLAYHDIRNVLPLEHFQKIRLIPVADEWMRQTLGVTLRKHHYISPAAKKFHSKLIAYFRQVNEELKYFS